MTIGEVKNSALVNLDDAVEKDNIIMRANSPEKPLADYSEESPREVVKEKEEVKVKDNPKPLNKLTTIKEEPRDMKDQSNVEVSNNEGLGDNLESHARPSETINSMAVRPYLDNYHIIKMLGKGDNTLYELEDKSDSSKACLRIITKKNLAKEDKDELMSKITSKLFIKDLNNPNLIKFKECWHDSTNFYFIHEYIEGKEILDYIQENPLCEEFVVKLVGKLVTL